MGAIEDAHRERGLEAIQMLKRELGVDYLGDAILSNIVQSGPDGDDGPICQLSGEGFYVCGGASCTLSTCAYYYQDDFPEPVKLAIRGHIQAGR